MSDEIDPIEAARLRIRYEGEQAEAEAARLAAAAEAERERTGNMDCPHGTLVRRCDTCQETMKTVAVAPRGARVYSVRRGLISG